MKKYMLPHKNGQHFESLLNQNGKKDPKNFTDGETALFAENLARGDQGRCGKQGTIKMQMSSQCHPVTFTTYFSSDLQPLFACFSL